ncbi:hypothetical protein HMPREF9577_00847 [Cutibacterium acnes HL110PA3]|nr:hypothetical protein HMPREF9577_00847 [Cutibacterium acnes HL110PA3]
MTGASGGAYHRRVISHDLHALGFDAPDLDALVNSAAEAGAVGVEDVGGFDLLAAYTDPSGARLALMKQRVTTRWRRWPPLSPRRRIRRISCDSAQRWR